MDVLGLKYKQHREEITHALTISTELLTLLTREGLLDIADCVKYQGITNSKRRTTALMKTLTDRRTDRAYTILLQCLRETGQHRAVDLLTDVGQEAHAIQELQLKLDEQVKAIDEFLETEERRAGLVPHKLDCGHGESRGAPPPATNDRQVWTDAQDSMRRAVDSLARCKTVISKLHEDCLQVANTNAELMTETRNCYLELCGMVRPSTKSASEIPTAATTTQELFRLLVSDVNRLMVQRSKVAEHEQQGRTSAMRVLRKLRDWIVDRCTVLNTLHSSAPSAPLGNSRFLQRRGRLQTQPITQPERNYLTTYKSLPDNLSTSDDISINNDTHGKKIDNPMLLDVIPSPQSPSCVMHPGNFHSSSFQDHNALVPIAPVASSTPQPGTINRELSASRLPRFNIQPISSVVEGVHQLESQLREYIHLEILLTDRFRQELRRRQQQKKSLGLSSKGIADAQSTLIRLATGYKGNQNEELACLRSQLDQISVEYSECCQYVDKAVGSLTQIEDVENFLKKVQDREQDYRKNKLSHDDKKDSSNLKIKISRRESKSLKREQDAYDALVELFRRGGKAKEKQDRNNLVLKAPHGSSPRAKVGACDTQAPTGNFLTRLKLLVANYEIVRLRMLTLEDRSRREAARRERDTKSLLQGRDDEIFRLQTLLREAEAEKDKYCRLYENTKIGTRKR